MDSRNLIYLKLQNVKNRLILLKSLESLIIGFFAGLLIWEILIITDKFYHFISFQTSYLYFIPFLLAIIFLFKIFILKFTYSDLAFVVDMKINLKERVSTAIEMMEQNVSSPIVDALIKDTAIMLNSFEPSSVFLFKLPLKSVVIMITALFLLLPLYFIPDPSEAFREFLFNKGKDLDLYSNNLIEEEKKINSESLISEDIKKLSEKLKSQNMTKKDALAELSSLEQKIKKQKDLLKATEMQNKLEKASLTEDMAKRLNNGEKAENILKELEEKIKKGQLSEREKQELSKKLNETLKNTDKSKESMEKLSQTFNKGDNKEILERLEQIGKEMEQSLKNEQEKEAIMNDALTKLEACEKEISNQSSEQPSDKEALDNMVASDAFSSNPTMVPLKKGMDNKSDYGKGSTNEEAEGKEISEKPYYNRIKDNKSDKTDEFVRIYSEERIKTNQSPTLISGKTGKGETYGTTPTRGKAEQSELAYKPYKTVYQTYRNDAEKAINTDKIPKGYRNLVRKYFNQIAPKGNVK